MASLGSPDLRSAQLSFMLAWIAEWAFVVGIGVVAYQDAGAVGVGIIGTLRMAPAALIAPLVAPLADRGRRERFLAVTALVRAAAFAGVAVLLPSDSVLPVYTLAVIASIVGTLYRPVHSALLPSLCRRSADISGANVVRGLIDSMATFVGPILAAVLLGAGQLPAIFAVAAGASLLAGMVAMRVRSTRAGTHPGPLRVLADVREGLAVVLATRPVLLLFILAAAQTATRGAVSVLVVMAAFDLLALGEVGVGTLTSAIGAGAIAGSLFATLLSRSQRLAVWFGVGVALWGAPLVVIAGYPSFWTAVLMLACVGVGNALVDVGLFTLPARLVSDAVLARVFTALESVIAMSVAAGSLMAPIAIGAFGRAGALVAIGVIGPVLVLLCWSRLRALDAAVVEQDRTIAQAVRDLALPDLSLPQLDHLVRQLDAVTCPLPVQTDGAAEPGMGRPAVDVQRLSGRRE